MSHNYQLSVGSFGYYKKIFVSMLLFKLKLMEGVYEKNTAPNMELLNAVLRLEELILKVNLNAETVPEYSYDKALLLLTDINGKPLSIEEQRVLKKIINSD